MRSMDNHTFAHANSFCCWTKQINIYHFMFEFTIHIRLLSWHFLHWISYIFRRMREKKTTTQNRRNCYRNVYRLTSNPKITKIVIQFELKLPMQSAMGHNMSIIVTLSLNFEKILFMRSHILFRNVSMIVVCMNFHWFFVIILIVSERESAVACNDNEDEMFWIGTILTCRFSEMRCAEKLNWNIRIWTMPFVCG